MPRDEILPEMLAATGVCAEFCARPEIWPSFEKWLRDDGYQTDGDTVTSDFLLAASRVLLLLIQQMESEILADKFRAMMSEN